MKTQQTPQWTPLYSPWRHGGWYVNNVRYPSGAVGCVSNNYEDKHWRIACDSRAEDYTFPTRDAAARAERELVALETAQKANADSARVAEVIAALAFNLGHEWCHTHQTTCQTIMDHVEGSFGLYQRVIAWSEEFDKAYEARPEDEKDDFIEAIDTFYAEKFAALKVEAQCIEV